MTISPTVSGLSRAGLLSRPSRTHLVQFAAALGLGLAALIPGGGASAQQPSSWQDGCSYKVPSGIPGNGMGVVNDACARLRFCQSMVDQGRDISKMSCFGFTSPARPSDKRS